MQTNTQTVEDGTQQRSDRATQGRLCLVRCANSTHLAYRDAEGKWISYFGRKDLDEVLEVLTGN